MRRPHLEAVTLALLFLAPTLRPALADGFTPAQRAEIVQILRDALKADPTIIRDALVNLQADEERSHERATSQLLAQLGGALVSPADAVEGNPAGDVTLVEFYDTRCPYCRRMLPVMTELMRAEPGLKLVMKDLPILGPASLLESRALLAAQKQGDGQGGYFKLRDALMTASAPSTLASIRATADTLGLDGARLLRDMDDPAIKTRLDANVALAQKLGIQGTPAIIIGPQLFAGATDLPELRQAVAAAREKR